MVILSGMNDQSVGRLMGLHRLGEFERSEPELPELIAAIMPHHYPEPVTIPLNLDTAVLDQYDSGTWQGRANRLSRDNPIPWEIIDEVTKVSWKEFHVVWVPLELASLAKERGMTSVKIR